MILIKDKEKINRIYVPKHYNSIDLEFKMFLHGLFTCEDYELKVIDVIPQDYYYVFDVDFSEFPDQEYYYLVFDNDENPHNDKCLSSGIIRVGKVKTQLPKHYENSTINIIQKDIKYYDE